MIRVLLVAAVLMYATPERAGAQSADSTRMRAALWASVRNVQQLELQVNSAFTGKQSALTVERARPLVERKEKAMHELRSRLDSAVFHTSWGHRELDALRKAYPGSMLFVEFDAMLADREHRDADALVLYDRLLTVDPTDVETQRHEGALLERMGRNDEARLAYARILEMQPEDDPAFRALVRLQTKAGTLAELLTRIQRLQMRFPKLRIVAEHNIELLQRLGRTAEAQAAALALKEHGK